MPSCHPSWKCLKSTSQKRQLGLDNTPIELSITQSHFLTTYLISQRMLSWAATGFCRLQSTGTEWVKKGEAHSQKLSRDSLWPARTQTMNQRRFAQKVFTLMKLNHLPSWECRLYVHILSQMYSTPVLMARQFLKCRIESKKKQPAPKKNFYSSRIIPAEWLASDLRASMKIQMTQLNLQCSRPI